MKQARKRPRRKPEAGTIAGAWGWWQVSLLGLPVLACGCLNPNTYSTPRTTPVRRVQHSLAAEVVSFRAVTPEEGAEPRTNVGNTVVAPSYAFRVGLTERLDVGGRIANASALGLDVKWNFLRSDLLDVAMAPGMQSFYVWGGAGTDVYSHVYTNLPLLVGINAAPEFTIAPSAGLGYGFNSSDNPSYNNAEERTSSTTALMLQAGLGLDFRISPTFAVHPEMSLLRRISGPAGATMSWYTFGLGFNWGALPSYGQVSAD